MKKLNIYQKKNKKKQLNQRKCKIGDQCVNDDKTAKQVQNQNQQTQWGGDEKKSQVRFFGAHVSHCRLIFS